MQSKEKGHKYALEAISHVAKKHKNIKYTILSNGPLREDLERYAKELAIENLVEFKGRVSDEEMVASYNNADVFLSPSIRASYGSEEGMGMVNQEAQLMELPVISTDIGGIPEGLKDKITGFVVPEKDSKKIAEKINFLIENTSKRRKMGKEGRKFVLQTFGPEKMISDLIKVYKN